MIREIEDEETEVTFSPLEEDRVVRDRLSEVNMIRQYAAESIQDCYRRYIACKPYKKSKRISESEKLVYHLASDTIKKFFAFKFYKKKQNRIKKYEEKFSYIDEAKNSGSTENKLLMDNIDDDKYYQEECKSPQAKQMTSVSPLPYSRSLISNRFEDEDNLYETKENSTSKDCIETVANITDDPRLVRIAEAKYVDNNDNVKMASKESKGTLNNLDEKISSNTTRIKAKKSAKVSEAKKSSNAEPANTKGSKDVAIQEVSNTTTKVSKAPAKTTQKVSNVNSDSIAQSKLVIDEALEAAMRAECSVIKLNVKEVAMILDALGYEITAGLENEVARENDGFSTRNHAPICELPMLNAPSLAATLSAFAKENKLVFDSKHFQISESKANIAVRHLSNLVQGPWSKIRSILLQLTKYEESVNHDNVSGLRKVKPSQWSSKYTNIFLRSLQLVSKNDGTSVDINSSAIDGEELLTVNRSMLKDVYGIVPSILQHRFCVYQHVLKLLNSWWSKGIRPDDVHVASKAGASTKSSVSVKDKDYKWGVFEGVFALGDDIPSVNGVELGNKVDVYVAPFSNLMQSWVPLNRAYGWNIPFEQLNLLGNVVGDSCGYIYRSNASRDDADATDIKGHRWVTLYKNNIDLAGSEVNGIIDSVALGESISKIAKYSFDNSCFSVLVPILCLRPNKSASSTLSVLKSPRTAGGVEIGKLYRIANEQSLRRACERFDWWDRPSPAILSKMAGNVGEVVAISELRSRQRVGIRVKDTLIVDALPLECLADMATEGDASESEFVDDVNTDLEADDRKRNSKKVKGKKKKTSKKKGSNSAVVKLLSNSNFGNEEVAVGIKGLPENVAVKAVDVLEDNHELDLESVASAAAHELVLPASISERNNFSTEIIIVPSPTRRDHLVEEPENRDISHDNSGQKRPLYRPSSSPEQTSLYRPVRSFSPVNTLEKVSVDLRDSFAVTNDQVRVAVHNRYDNHSINVYWMPDAGDDVLLLTLLPFETQAVTTTVGHKFYASTNDGLIAKPGTITVCRGINDYYFGDEDKEKEGRNIKVNPSQPLLNLDIEFDETDMMQRADKKKGKSMDRQQKYSDRDFDDAVISIPSPRQEATDYSWLRSIDRHPLQFSHVDAKEVESQTTQRDDDERNRIPALRLDMIPNHEAAPVKSPVPMLNVCVPVFDSENAVFADGKSRYYDTESMTATKIAVRPPSVPSYVRKVKNMNNQVNNRDRFNMEDDLPDSPIKDGSNITVKGNHKPLAVPTERTRKVVNRNKEDDDLMKEVQPVSPSIVPRPPKGRSKQLEFDANIVPDKVIERIEYVDGLFGVEGRGVSNKEINCNVKSQDQASENKASPKKQTRPKSALGSSHKAAGQAKPEDVQFGLAATNINIQKRPKSAYNPTSLAEHVQKRLERGNNIVDSMEVNEEEFLRRELLRSSQENRSKEKWLEKQIEEISKM